jgi:pimeloyl-[acyl-carrier protein] methyl ester esterase
MSSHLHIETIGTGQPLVMLHGWGMHSGIWNSVRDGLSQQHALHLIDLPGMGFSQTQMADNLPELAEEIARQIPANAAVLGWSLGGLVAMELALQGKLDKLILVSTTPCFVDRNDWQHGIPHQVFNGFFAEVMQDFVAALEKFLALIAMGSSHSRQEVRTLLEVMLQRPHPRMQALEAGLKILLQTDLRGQMPHIQQPVLWIHGSRDRLCPQSAAQWSIQHMPHAQLEIFDAAGHEPFISHPAQFIDSVNRFLQS